MKICVLIPTYNEAKEIVGLINKIQHQDLDVLVVDDGSKDHTARIAKESGAAVIRNTKNEGKGASLVKGFRYCLEHDYDVCITMDGDGQHLPQDLPHFIRKALHSPSPIIIGNRMESVGTMPLIRIATNRFMSWLISYLAGQEIPDTQCGFRLIKRELLKKVNLRTNKYEMESEILVQASRLGYKIESIPVKSVYSSEKSRIHPVLDTLRFIRFVIKEIWSMPH
jgi:glycosyltransferase involved in cell wall biosynthesis